MKKIAKKKIIDALHENRGNIAKTAKALDCYITDIFVRINSDKDIQNALNQIHKENVILITDKLEDQCISGDIKSINTLLRYSPNTHDAGWIEDSKITVREEKPLTADEKEKLKKELFGA